MLPNSPLKGLLSSPSAPRPSCLTFSSLSLCTPEVPSLQTPSTATVLCVKLSQMLPLLAPPMDGVLSCF